MWGTQDPRRGLEPVQKAEVRDEACSGQVQLHRGLMSHASGLGSSKDIRLKGFPIPSVTVTDGASTANQVHSGTGRQVNKAPVGREERRGDGGADSSGSLDYYVH